MLFLVSLVVWAELNAYYGYGLIVGLFIICGVVFFLDWFLHGDGDNSKPLTVLECVSLYCFKTAWLLISSFLAFTAAFLLVHMTINFFAKG
ncbi:hypothetical protein ACGP04_00860 [Piscirickettsia salmonis]|uniref:hypothetical protein n=1 Tax=Piscirickettsia salmonis TaxID=1238 RepID=UPI0039F5606A